MPIKTHHICALVLMATCLVMSAPYGWADGPATSPERERELLDVLRSAAPSAHKAITCKKLAIYGSSASVGELAKLLPDPQLSSWARIALEAIPGAEADAALRSAAGDLEGRLLIGMLNSIGVRRDPMAVADLNIRLQDPDGDVAAAAAVALGRIGTVDATQALRRVLPIVEGQVRSAVAEGCVLCAERMLAEGRAAEAAELYDEVREAEVPQQRVIEATRGAILARGNAGIPLLLDLLQSPDKPLFQLGLSTAREFPGSEVDQALAAELEKLAPVRAALVVNAMADRSETVVLPAIVNAAGQGDHAVRLAALSALGQVGDASCLASLLKIATESDVALANAACSALATLPDVDQQIVAQLDQADSSSYRVLLTLVGQRRIGAVPQVLKALQHSDAAVRGAALTALGETISIEQLSTLIQQVVSPPHDEDLAIARQALKSAAVRMPDRETCAAMIAKALDQTSNSDTKSELLDILAAVGGTNALVAMGAAAKSDDPQQQDVSSRLLGQWMSDDAAPVLLDLAKTASNDKYRVRALRGYIRIARQFVLPAPQRAEMCENALHSARQPAEQRLVLQVLQRYPSEEMLQLAMVASKLPGLKDEATQTAMTIIQKIGGDADAIRELVGKVGLDSVKLEIVKAEYGSGGTQVDVTERLRKQVGNLPLISLPSSSYNKTFGGDPAPGSVKRLKISYRINDRAGEATFAENAVILLPMPR